MRPLAVFSVALVAVVSAITACDHSPLPPAAGCDSVSVLQIDSSAAILGDIDRTLSVHAENQAHTAISPAVTWASITPAILHADPTTGTISRKSKGEGLVVASACQAADTVTVLVLGSYSAQAQPVLYDTMTLLDVDNSGRVLAKNGTAAYVGSVVSDCLPVDMNNFGQVACTMNSRNAPALFESALSSPVLQPIFADTSKHATAIGISDSGYMVFKGTKAIDSVTVWRIASGPVRYLYVDFTALARGVSNRGAVGLAMFSGQYVHAFVSMAGGLRDITSARMASVSRMNDSGFVLGSLEPVPLGGSRAAYWTPMPGSTWSAAVMPSSEVLTDVNDSGVVIGYMPNDANGAFMIRNGRRIPLSQLALGWSFSTAVAISSNGTILARGKQGGTTRTVLIKPF